jgi:hypothetical protein
MVDNKQPEMELNVGPFGGIQMSWVESFVFKNQSGCLPLFLERVCHLKQLITLGIRLMVDNKQPEMELNKGPFGIVQMSWVEYVVLKNQSGCLPLVLERVCHDKTIN